MNGSQTTAFGRVGIDLLEGPTEVLFIADETAELKMVACDRPGQAEHGLTSPAALITTSRTVAEQTLAAIQRQLQHLPTAAIAGMTWADHGKVLCVANKVEAVEEANRLAYEHVEVLTKDPSFFLEGLANYGALFLGPEISVAYGNKVIGTNHILPTKGAARYTGGLSVGKFLKNSPISAVHQSPVCRSGRTPCGFVHWRDLPGTESKRGFG